MLCVTPPPRFPLSDIDECRTIPDICGPNATCINTIGSYRCECRAGYVPSNRNTTLCKGGSCRWGHGGGTSGGWAGPGVTQAEVLSKGAASWELVWDGAPAPLLPTDRVPLGLSPGPGDLSLQALTSPSPACPSTGVFPVVSEPQPPAWPCLALGVEQGQAGEGVSRAARSQASLPSSSVEFQHSFLARISGRIGHEND